MDFITLLAVSLGLSFDTFAISLSFGVINNAMFFRQAVRVALIFAVFQAGLMVAGYFLASVVSAFMKATDHWVALCLLSILGIRMIIEGAGRKENEKVRDYTRLPCLMTSALSTSIDAFAVGISFALLDIRIWESSILIGIITFLASMTAIRIGKSAGKRLGKNVEIIGGLILIAIGIKIFVAHISGV